MWPHFGQDGLACLNANTGEKIWQNPPKPFGNNFILRILNGVLYYVDESGKLTGLETSTGETILSMQTPDNSLFAPNINNRFQPYMTLDKVKKRIYIY